ncbi:MAG TPA: mechanosensitive ion channel domain-containing protein [Allosphingosinicella sp.]|jgi:small-conductance mechanosensitive channel
MSNQSGRVTEATQNFTEQTSAIATEAGRWITTNAVDVAIAALAGTLIAFALIGIRALAVRTVRRMAAADNPHWPLIFAKAAARTNLFFIVMCAAELVGEHAATPPEILRVIHILFVVAAAIQAAIWARELILGYIQHRAGVDDEHSTLSSAIGIIRLLVTVALFAIAIVLILDNLGVNVTGLIAGLGIGGIAIGLAAQGIFADLFAALSIIFDQPFRRGQTITFGTPPTTGTVERIGLKSTRIRSLNGEEVVISNTKLLESQLQNWAPLQRRRGVMVFGLTYQTPAETIEAIGAELRAIVDAVPGATFDRAHATQFGASSIDFEFIFHVESADIVDFMAARQAIMVAMMKRFPEVGADFAYPTQVTYTAAPDGTFVMPYAQVPAAGKAAGEGASSLPAREGPGVGSD